MAETEEFVRFLYRRWASLRVRLSLEQEGLLIRISTWIYENRGQALSGVEKEAAKALAVNKLQYRKVLAELIALGELEVGAEGIVSARAVAEWQRSVKIKADASVNGKKGQQAKRDRANPPGNPPGNGGGNPPSNPPGSPPGSPLGFEQPNAENKQENGSHPEAIRLREEEDKKKKDSAPQEATGEAVASRSSSPGGLFSLDEQGAGLVRNGSQFKWLDPKTGEPQRLTFHFIASMAPHESRELVIDFAENELLAAIESGKEGSLHGILRSAINKGRLGAFKRMRQARPSSRQLEDCIPEGGAPLTEGSWD